MTHPCHVPDCGQRRCSTCDERLMCVGPEPAVNTCPDHADECGSCNGENPCRLCQMTRRNAQIWADADNGPRPTWTPGQEDAEHWAEQRAEERRLPHIDPREDDRGADRDWERRWPA